MRRSRYFWILVMTILCLSAIIAWKSPQAVLSAMAHPGYADTPRATVMNFWNMMDNRQIKLAKELTIVPATPEVANELELWAQVLEKNPLLSLNKIEIGESSKPEVMTVNVSWSYPSQEVQNIKYIFGVTMNEGHWKIININRLPN